MVGNGPFSWCSYALLSAVLFTVEPILPQDALQYVGSQEALFLDVREPSEYETGHVPGSILMPWISGVLQERWSELPTDRLIIVYCHSGGRATRAAAFLEGKGFTRLANMGGFPAYAALANAPVETGPYEEQTPVVNWAFH